MGNYDWRLSEKNVWKVERMLLEYPHRDITSSDERIDRLRRKFFAFKDANPGKKPLYYSRMERWKPIPREFE
jgi:hypothetical protein